MPTRFAVVMDPIANINIKKDSTFAMLLAAQSRGWELYYLEQKHLYVRDGVAYGQLHTIKVTDDSDDWFELSAPNSTPNSAPAHQPLSELDAIFMRKDPPFDMEYIYTTYILELAEQAGVKVFNRPQSLRDANEKFYTALFPECCPPTLVTSDAWQLKQFFAEYQDVIFKPLEGMGGVKVFHLRPGNPNTNVIIETLTEYGQKYIIAQRYIPEISQGDKRILLINGEPVPYGLARIPPADDSRGNLAIGAKGVGFELSERDHWICQQLAPTMREKGLLFVGIDVIGDYLTEINVTSPTCIREIDALYNLDIAGQICDAIDAALN